MGHVHWNVNGMEWNLDGYVTNIGDTTNRDQWIVVIVGYPWKVRGQGDEFCK
jgi:hypothetical protein